MSRKKTKSPKPRILTPEQGALLQLRGRMKLSQAEMARELQVAMQTISLWETRQNPRGYILLLFRWIAENNGYPDLAKVFTDAIERLKTTDPRLARDIQIEYDRWTSIDSKLSDLHSKYGIDDLWQELDEVRVASWRNRR